jgi:hypothetical protein
MNRHVSAWIVAGLLVASSALAGGCARREHIRADYGEPSRAWFQAQARATERDRADGLDSEEAALIHQSYRGVLGRGGARAQDQSQVLIIEEPSRNDRRSRR